MCGGSVTSAGLLQRTSSWHQRLWNASAVMVGCRPLSQWLSTPARSLMSEPTSSQSRRIWILAAEMTLAAMCAGCVGCSGRDLARQYASHSCVMTSKRSRCHKLSYPAAGCQGPRLSSASRRSACSGGAGCWVTAVHVAANQCQTARETGQLSMTWLRVASCSWQAACGQRCDSGVPLWMCLWKAPTKSLPCSRRQTTTRPGLSKAAEVAALHVCAHSGLEGCASAREAMSVSSLCKAARTRCLGVSSAG